MQFNFRRWFDSPTKADTLLRIRCQQCQTQLVCPIGTTTSGQHEPAQAPTAEASATTATEGRAGACIHDTDQCHQSAAAQESEQATNGTKKRSLPDDSNSSEGFVSKRRRDAQDALQAAKVYHAHAVVLCAQSAFFEASLSNVWQPEGQQQHDQQQQQHDQRQDQQQQQQEREEDRHAADPESPSGSDTAVQAGPSSRVHELTLTVEPDELEAMDLLLRIIYGFELPAASPETATLLLQCLRLADRFDVPQCVDMLLTQLKVIATRREVLQFVFNAPPGVTSKPAFQAVLGDCESFVLSTYSNIPAVIRSEQLRGEFCSLPFNAVLAWAKSDELKVHSENCVVYLLSAWVKAAQQAGGQGVSSEQLEQLSQQVRVLHLGPAYQHHILPQLGWFKGCSGMAYLPTLLAYKGVNYCRQPVFPAAGLNFPTDCQKFPSQWVAKPRQQARMTNADQLLTWEVGGEQLQELHEGKFVCSPPLYLNGFLLSLGAESSTGDGGTTLGMYTGVEPAQAGSGIAWPQDGSVLIGSLALRVVHGPAGSVNCSMPNFVRWGFELRGHSNVLSKSAPTMSELLTPHLQDGKLCLEVHFTTVDTR